MRVARLKLHSYDQVYDVELFTISLMYQFKREANVYFLLQAILNSIPQVSAMNPITAWSPLAFVLGVSMLREGLEDYQRYKSDLSTNK